MGGTKIEQHFLVAGDRTFHFVSYEPVAAHAKRGEVETPRMWYLMGPGKRWPVMPHVAGQPEADLDIALHRWMTDQGILASARSIRRSGTSQSRATIT